MGSLVYNLTLTDKSSIKNYTYKDVRIDIVNNLVNNRDIEANFDYNAVEGGINNMFLFAPGERIIQPEFGNTIYRYLYEPINELTARKIGEGINKMFQKWEPRVSLQSINVIAFPDENTYRVEVLYTVPSLNGGKLQKWNTSLNARR